MILRYHIFIIKEDYEMKLLKNLCTIIRGGANEVSEFIIDSQNMRILDQKMREADVSLKKGEEALTSVIADREQSEREITIIKSKLKEYDEIIKKCFKEKKEGLAAEVASKIAELEAEVDVREKQFQKLLKTEDILNAQRKKISSHLNEIKRQISLLKAQASLNKALKTATDAIGVNHPEVGEVNSMICNIQNKQQHELDKIMAKEKLKNDDLGLNLERKLSDSGIIQLNKNSTEQILDRYKKAEGGSVCSSM